MMQFIFATLAFIEAVVLVALVVGRLRPASASDRLLGALPGHAGAVDPWRLQRLLMEASGQALPQSPIITKDTLLYWALTEEEQGEMTEALANALQGAWRAPTTLMQHDVINTLHSMAARHTRTAKMMRGLITEVGLVHVVLKPCDAVTLLDGTTDVAVVNAGFALSAGLPGSEAYLEVQTSNLSKRNVAGKIDKQPDGKWIKGPGYQPPDLGAVLARPDWVAPR